MPRNAPSWCVGALLSMKTSSILLITCIAMIVSAGCSKTESTAAAAGGGGGAPTGKGGGRRGGGGDVPVTVATIGQKNVPVEVQVIGNVEAYATISLKAQVTGQLT